MHSYSCFLKKLYGNEYEKAADKIAEGKIFDKQEILSGAGEYYDLNKAIQKYLGVYKKILG